MHRMEVLVEELDLMESAVEEILICVENDAMCVVQEETMQQQ